MPAHPTAAEAPEGAPKPDDLFADKYVVERVLGVGGMGYVLAATHVHLHERVAIKILLPDLVDDYETVQRFLREGRAAVRIQSSHVARVKDVGEVEGTPYIVMEYLDGSDLGVVIEERGKLPFALAVDYVLEACEAIAEAHGMKTVHRDLKPSNLFLTRMPNGTTSVKVLDFGISKLNAGEPGAVNITSTLAVMGSPAYMSPEQLKASRAVDHRADIWSIGIVLYELICGKPPFGAQTIAELCVQILSDDPPWLAEEVSDVPAPLASVIATCLRKKADERFSDLADLADALAPFGSDAARRSSERIVQTLGMPQVRAVPSVAPPAPTVRAAYAVTVRDARANDVVTDAPPPATRSRSLVALIGAVALFGAGAGGFALWPRPSRSAGNAPPAPVQIAGDTASTPTPLVPVSSAITSLASGEEVDAGPRGGPKAAAVGGEPPHAVPSGRPGTADPTTRSLGHAATATRARPSAPASLGSVGAHPHPPATPAGIATDPKN